MGVNGQHHTPAALLPRKDIQFPFYMRLGGHLGPGWMGAESLAPTRI